MVTIDLEIQDKNTLVISVSAEYQEYLNYILNDIQDVMLVQEEWQSKYNSYVKYDYAPFCIAGCIYKAYYKGEINFVEFAKRCIKEKVEKIAYLETCLQKESAEVSR